jgi:hypothetical protein
VPGFPIRKSSDQSSVDSSPRHIAASHVLHRLPVPRHPPCALKHLQHKKPDIKNYGKKLHHNKPHTPGSNPERPEPETCGLMLATTIHKSNTTPHHQRQGDNNHPPHPPRRADTRGRHLHTPQGGRRWACCLRTQQCVRWHQPEKTPPAGQSQRKLVCRAPTRPPLQRPS